MVIADGAMGTELRARAPGTDRPAQLNLEAPELVRTLHCEYLAAGARLLVANTLAATPEEAAAGVRLAREAIGAGQAVLAGSLAAEPLPQPELVSCLSEADVLILETVTSLAALSDAINVLRRVADKPILATISFGRDGAVDGLEPAEVAEALQPLGLAAFGYGCGFGPKQAASVMRALRQAAPGAALIAKPSLGLPAKGQYPITPAQLAAWAADMAELGVQIVGACCGSTPVHIQAIADRLEAQRSEPGGEII